VEDLNNELSEYLGERPTIFDEYRLTENIVELIDALMIKWRLAEPDTYLYRTSGRTLNVKMLNLRTLNRQFITMETLWYT
jgi:hypothetical protein